jgi:leucyl aminopeptidase
LKSGDISGKPGSSIAPQRCRNGSGTGVLLVGLGEAADTVSEKAFQQAVQAAARSLANLGANDVVIAAEVKIVIFHGLCAQLFWLSAKALSVLMD